MRKTIYLVFSAITLMLSGHANAAGVIISTSGNGTIQASQYTQDIPIADFNQDGLPELSSEYYNKNTITVGAPDANGVSTFRSVGVSAYELIRPGTGVRIGRTAPLVDILNLHVTAAKGFPDWQGWGFGIFSEAGVPYSASIVGAQSNLPAGAYKDASISVVIVNTTTGAAVKRFSLSSFGTWHLKPQDCLFTDATGDTRVNFVENYGRVVRQTATKKVIQKLIKVWNFNRTVLIKWYVKKKIKIL